MSAVNAFETELLELLFNNDPIANIGDGTGLTCGTADSAQVSLHTVALDDTDTLLTADECDYTGYVRQTVARTAGGWTIAGDSCTNAALIQFGNMSAGASDTAVHCGIGLISTGDVLRIHAAIGTPLVVNIGVNPQFAIGALEITLE